MSAESAPAIAPSAKPIVRHLGLVEYEPTWRAMQRFTDARESHTPDEIWFVEHPPVFTLGLAASREHLLAPGDIPVVQIDRGGQVTYHGPGQLVVYPLVDLRRRQLTVRSLVVALEDAVIDLLAEWGILATGSREAPGVYVRGAKLASIGLRIRRGSSYHGMSLNVSLDLEPFSRINVCGYRDLRVTRLVDLGAAADSRGRVDSRGMADLSHVAHRLTPHLIRRLGPIQSAMSTALQAVSSR